MKFFILTVAFVSLCESFTPVISPYCLNGRGSYKSNSGTSIKYVEQLQLSSGVNDEDYNEVEPGTMRVAEIKSELDLRGIDYSDCFDKESLAQKLVKARSSGISDPSLIDQFNKHQLEKDSLEIDDEMIEKATGGDGTLPGGMPPDMLKQLMSNPELLELMRDPKMQEVMKLMMSGGQDAIEVAMIEDKETFELITKLNTIMGKSM